MFYRSERLFLRPAWPEDARAIQHAIASEAVVRNLASAPWPFGEMEAQAFATERFDPFLPRFLITLPSNGSDTASTGGHMIGAVGLARSESGEIEIGYWIARPHWGRGYATEAVRAVTEIARGLGHTRIAAAHFADNPASGRVLRKAAFRPTGIVRPRFGRGRGESASAVEYACELSEVCGIEHMRAA